MRFLLSVVMLLTLAIVSGHAWADKTKGDVEVSVRALMESPEAYTGQIQIAGVVSQVVPESKMFGLIDLEEFKTCQKVTCASLVLPIEWDGAMPEVGQQLTAVGEIQKEDKRYLFKASKVAPVSGK